MAADTQTKPTDLVCHHPHPSSPSVSLLLSSKADTHFTVRQRVEGWVDLATAVRVQQPVPKTAFSNGCCDKCTAGGMIRTWVLSHRRGALQLDYCDLAVDSIVWNYHTSVIVGCVTRVSTECQLYELEAHVKKLMDGQLCADLLALSVSLWIKKLCQKFAGMPYHSATDTISLPNFSACTMYQVKEKSQCM